MCSILIQGIQYLFTGFNWSQPMQGWKGVSWGASYDTVKIRFPKALASDNELVLKNQEPSLKNYSVTLSFDKTRQLNQVSLDFKGGDETNEFSRISQELTEKFGLPTLTTQNKKTWMRDETQIELSTSAEGQVILNEKA